MLTGWEKIDPLRSCLIINQQERGIYKDQEVDGRIFLTRNGLESTQPMSRKKKKMI
jgi:hypothetical protein